METLEGVELRRVEANGIAVQVAVAGSGPTAMLVHGWPFDWTVWRKTIPGLVTAGHRVVAPDLRGVGGSSRPEGGYDPHALADDLAGTLAALGIDRASLVAFDVGAWPAAMLALRRPDLVDRLVLSESLLGALPGAEGFLKDGPPWWYGFHEVPGLAERAVEGNEAAYLGWFLDALAVQPIDPEDRDRFVRVHSGRDALRGGLGPYRAMEDAEAQYAEAFRGARLRQPTLVVGAGLVKDCLRRQLEPLSDDLRYEEIADCGHVVPLEQPERLVRLILEHLGR